MHSGTKYLGGHSDLLAGVLVVKTLEDWNKVMDLFYYAEAGYRSKITDSS